MQSPSKEISIVPVENKKDLQAFIKFPWKIYSRDSAWVPPLILERKLHLSENNPFLKRAFSKFWLAYRNKELVGRISAQIDPLYYEQHKRKCGYFGMLEAENNTDTFRALFNTAESWLKKNGREVVQGPFNLSINEELGLLVDGFQTSPYFMMPHNPQYYPSQVINCAYEQEEDLLAYRLNADFAKPYPMRRSIQKYRHQINLRCVDKKNFTAEMSVLKDIFNDAWSENWGFVPFTEQEFQELGKQLKYAVPAQYVLIAEVEDEPAGMFIAVPNFNEMIKDLNGKLLPFNCLKLLYRIFFSSPTGVRVPLMGIRKKYQNSFLGAALVYRLIEAVQPEVLARGVKEVELSWILQDNYSLQKILSTLGARVNKRYRIYSKRLV